VPTQPTSSRRAGAPPHAHAATLAPSGGFTAPRRAPPRTRSSTDATAAARRLPPPHLPVRYLSSPLLSPLLWRIGYLRVGLAMRSVSIRFFGHLSSISTIGGQGFGRQRRSRFPFIVCFQMSTASLRWITKFSQEI
jgi:hypothetical protein